MAQFDAQISLAVFDITLDAFLLIPVRCGNLLVRFSFEVLADDAVSLFFRQFLDSRMNMISNLDPVLITKMAEHAGFL